jgi:hypothetical protein
MTPRPHPHMALLLACWLGRALVAHAAEDTAPPIRLSGIAETNDRGSALANLKLRGLALNLDERFVDVDATVCLDQGTLELVACAKDTKEHESIFVIDAEPMHIHTALLLLGAESGNPAMRKLVAGDDGERWVDVPPRGGEVDLSVVFKNKDGKTVERPIRDFISRLGDADADARFPTSTFLFAGSQLVGDGPGPRKYVAGMSGNVISIATFGDELLCLPEVHSQENGALLWQIDATHLPIIGSKVKLRLRPRLKPSTQAGRTKAPSKP